MNKNIINKLKEAGSFIVCIAVLLGIGYYTGFLKGFAPEDFVDAYQKIVYNLSKKAPSNEVRSNILSTGNSTSKKSSSYENYRLRTIPQTVIDGAYESNTWLDVFNADKKVIFYVYDPSGNNRSLSPDFHERIEYYLNTKEMKPYYKVVAYSASSFKNIKAGMIGPSKICDSLEECNKQRKAASDYSNMAEFFKQCGKTSCIINPYNNKYVILKSRNYAATVHALSNLKEW